MATLTAYSTSGDGFVRNNGSSAWATLRNAATGTVASQFNPASAPYNDGTTADKYIDRGFFSFDLSSIPPNATINSATLSFYVTASSAGAGGAVAVVSGSPASTTTLATSDFDDVGSTEYATRVNFADATTSAYNNFALNSAGLTYLGTKLGTTAGFALRGSFDLDNSAPGTTVYSGWSISTSEQSGTSQDPKLVVNYTPPERTTADTWAWSDSNTVTAGGGTTLNHLKATGDAWAWSDAVTVYRRSTVDVVVTAAGPNTTLSGSQNLSGAGTITVVSTTDFASSGTAYIIDSTTSNQQQGVFTYTGKTSTTFTGCSFTSLIGSTTFAGTNSGVAAANGESHFPQVTRLDETDTPPLLISYTQHGGHSVLRGSLKFKKSTDGGMTWGSEQTIIASPHNGSAWGIYGHLLKRLKNGRLFCMWYEHKMDYTVADSIAYFWTMASYSDDNGATWSTPVEYDTPFDYGTRAGSMGFGSDLYVGSGSNSTYGDLYVPVYGNDDGIQVHGSGEPYRWYSKLMKITDGGAGGTWTEVSDMATTTDVGGRAVGEPSLLMLSDDLWVAQFRVENLSTGETSPYYPNYQRWQATSTDKGVTWSGHTRFSPLGNGAVNFEIPGGTMISVGQDIDRSTGATSYISTDQGATWRFNRVEATDGTYAYYNGSDGELIIDDAFVSRNTAFTWADEKSNQVGARTQFRWFIDPSRAFDSWAWSDSATGTTARSRTASDSWAWSDSAVGEIVSFTTADSWAWSDSVSRSAQSFSRGLSDAWTWSESASAQQPIVDTWSWADVASVSTSLVGPEGRSGFSITSVVGASVVMDGVVDASVTFTAVV